MNTTELKQDLDRLVRDVTAEAGFAVGVAAKVRGRKRARAVAASVAGVALLGVGAGLVPQLLDGPRTPTPAVNGPTVSVPTPTTTAVDGLPSRVAPPAPGDVVKNGLRLRGQVGDNTLAVGVIGNPGETGLSLTWTPTTTHVSLGAQCYLPGLDAAEASKVQIRLSLVGAEGSLASGSCDSKLPTARDLQPATWVPGDPGAGWQELTVGRSATVRAELTDSEGRPLKHADARVVAAVYDQGPQRVLVAPTSGRPLVALPEVVEHEGYRYALATVVSGPSGTRLAAVPTPGGQPFLVSFGSAGAEPVDASVPSGVRLAGLSTETGLLGSGWTTEPQPSRPAASVQLVREGPQGAPGGIDFVALYTLER